VAYLTTAQLSAAAPALALGRDAAALASLIAAASAHVDAAFGTDSGGYEADGVTPCLVQEATAYAARHIAALQASAGASSAGLDGMTFRTDATGELRARLRELLAPLNRWEMFDS
jgi:hypothetical protein